LGGQPPTKRNTRFLWIRVSRRRPAIHPLSLQTQQRQTFFPCGLALLPVGDINSRVAVVVAGDLPIKTERERRGWFGGKLSRDSRGLRLRAASQDEEDEDSDSFHTFSLQ